MSNRFYNVKSCACAFKKLLARFSQVKEIFKDEKSLRKDNIHDTSRMNSGIEMNILYKLKFINNGNNQDALQVESSWSFFAKNNVN